MLLEAGGHRLTAGLGTLRHAVIEAGAFLQSAQSGPEGSFDGVALLGAEMAGREGMSDAAAKAEEAIVLQLPQDSATIGARECRGRAGAFFVGQLGHFLLQKFGFFGLERIAVSFRRSFCWRPTGNFLCDQANQFRRNLVEGEDLCVRDLVEGVARHRGKHRGAWVLDDGGAAVRTDDHEAGGSVVEHAGEDDADHTASAAQSCGAEKRIDGGSVQVFSRTLEHTEMVVLDEHMEVGRSDVDVTSFYAIAVGGVGDGQAGGSGENLRKKTVAVSGSVNHDEHSGFKVSGKGGQQLLEGLNAPGGSSDDDPIAVGHGCLLTL